MTKSLFLDLSPSKPVRLSSNPSITLTDAEDHICTLLDDFTRELKQAKGISTSCRVAGGWVRDKVFYEHSQPVFLVLKTRSYLA
jgi:tRNA nucleotidyltransferase (CCA-adding enzyme)